jgi:amino-acid N-acetyltransferase
VTVGETADFVSFFRACAPYVHAHRGRTFVIRFAGEAVQSRGFDELVHDVALMHALGIRLVLVHGARPQIDARLVERGLDPRYEGDLRVTDAEALRCFEEAVGTLRVNVEARLSMGLPSSPMEGARIRVASGNFVVARPLGVVDGVDHGYTGIVRRVDVDGIRQRLDAGAIVLLSPLGYSLTGDVYNVDSHVVAAESAAALGADKLVCLVEGALPSLGPELTPDEAAAAVADGSELGDDGRRNLTAAVRACRGGVRRAHLIDRTVDGGLLRELFTRDGAGTMVTSETYEGVRAAALKDVTGMLELLAPLEAAGVLVRRPRELLEADVERFTVVERDGLIVACAALHLHGDTAEIAAVAVHPQYRDGGRGDTLLAFLERRARAEGVRRLVVLTTQTEHWFVERGYSPGGLEDLPEPRRAAVDRARGSKVFVKTIG